MDIRKYLEKNSLSNVLLLTGIRSIRVPVEDGYITCESNKDILDALYYVSPEEIKIVAAYVGDIQNDYSMVFSFGDVKCPKCGNVTRNMTISMDYLISPFKTSCIVGKSLVDNQQLVYFTSLTTNESDLKQVV